VAETYDFTGRTIVVTGGAGVLGGEIACSLVACGARVAILDKDPSLANRLQDRLRQGPGSAIVVGSDVLDAEALAESAEVIRNELGTVDTLVNAAGGNHPRATTSDDLSFFDLPAEALRFVGELNLLGTILPCQVFGRSMADAQRGVILNISSMNAYRPLTRIPAYSAAKAAVSKLLALGRKYASLPWENPRTGARGTVTPITSAYSAAGGRTCRDFLASYINGASQAWLQGEACKHHTGPWVVRSMKPWKSS